MVIGLYVELTAGFLQWSFKYSLLFYRCLMILICEPAPAEGAVVSTYSSHKYYSHI